MEATQAQDMKPDTTKPKRQYIKRAQKPQLSEEEASENRRNSHNKKMECNICRKSCSRSNMAKHLKSQKHLEKMELFIKLFGTGNTIRQQVASTEDIWGFVIGKNAASPT